MTLNSAIKKQILKDAELLERGTFDNIVWHFWNGVDQKVLDYLTEHGISYVVH